MRGDSLSQQLATENSANMNNCSWGVCCAENLVVIVDGTQGP
jgi:hypothetical protein